VLHALSVVNSFRLTDSVSQIPFVHVTVYLSGFSGSLRFV